MTTIYEQLLAERRFQRWVDHFADPDPISVAVTLRAPTRPCIESECVPHPVSSDDHLVAAAVALAHMGRGS